MIGDSVFRRQPTSALNLRLGRKYTLVHVLHSFHFENCPRTDQITLYLPAVARVTHTRIARDRAIDTRAGWPRSAARADRVREGSMMLTLVAGALGSASAQSPVRPVAVDTGSSDCKSAREASNACCNAHRTVMRCQRLNDRAVTR
jgi:hypothetical protein